MVLRLQNTYLWEDIGEISNKQHGATCKPSLWDAVKERLAESALNLSGGQKQRLCIARALGLSPEVLLCDEPTSALDAKAAGIIGDLLVRLRSRCTRLVVSHDVDQVRCTADHVFALAYHCLQPIWLHH